VLGHRYVLRHSHTTGAWSVRAFYCLLIPYLASQRSWVSPASASDQIPAPDSLASTPVLDRRSTRSVQLVPPRLYLGRACSLMHHRPTIFLGRWCTSSSCICRQTPCDICSPSSSPKASSGRPKQWQTAERYSSIR
jgi:hypothetical protein